MSRNIKGKEETYYSQKELKPRKLYHISIKSTYDPISNLHQVSLFINGFDDLMMNFNFFNPFDSSQISVGQFHDSPPFVGTMKNLLLFLSSLADLEIRRLAENYDIDEILKQTVFAESMKSFLDETRVPQNGFTELSVADEFFDKVEEDKLGEQE